MDHTQHNVDITQILQEVMAENCRRSQSRSIGAPEGGVASVEDGHVKQKFGVRNGTPTAKNSRSPEQKSATIECIVVEDTETEDDKEDDKRFGKQKKQNSEDEEMIRPEEVNMDTIVVERPKPQGANKPRRDTFRPSYTDTVVGFGVERGKKSIYTEEPKAEDDKVQGTSRRVNGLRETNNHQGGEPGTSAKGLPTRNLKKATGRSGTGKPGSKRSQTRSETNSSITGFSFVAKGGNMKNENVGVMHVHHDDDGRGDY